MYGLWPLPQFSMWMRWVKKMHHNGNKLLTDVTIILFSLCFPLSFVSVIFIYSFLLHISFIFWNCIIRIISRFARVHMFVFLSRSLISLIRNIPPKHTHSHIHTHKLIKNKRIRKIASLRRLIIENGLLIHVYYEQYGQG